MLVITDTSNRIYCVSKTQSNLRVLSQCSILCPHVANYAYLCYRCRVWPHRKRPAAAGSELCPRREGLRTILRKTASSPSNRKTASHPSNKKRLHDPRQTEGGLTSAASARLLFDGDDAVVRNTVRRPSRRGHRSLPAAAARFLCGQTLNGSDSV